MSIIEIEIVNWKKYNERGDRTNYTWFRFQNSFFQDQHIWGLNDGHKLLYLFLLCIASKSSSGKISVEINFLAANLSKNETEIKEGLQQLIRIGVIMTAESRQKPVIQPRNGSSTDRQTNSTYQNVADKSALVSRQIPLESKFKTAKDLWAAMHLVTMDRWRAKYDTAFLEHWFVEAFDYYSAQPESRFWTITAWTSRINACLSREIKKQSKPVIEILRGE